MECLVEVGEDEFFVGVGFEWEAEYKTDVVKGWNEVSWTHCLPNFILGGHLEEVDLSQWFYLRKD